MSGARLASPVRQTTTTGRIVLASMVGTAIEFYDFYIYGTAARPVGSFLFGHFGDRKGRKSTLVWSLVVMGLSTTLIGALPTYATAGALAPVLLCMLRLGQGIGLGGEWGGATLLATENAPRNRQALFGMFPQLGPPLGFLLSNGLFLLLFTLLTDEQFAAWGWRVPFLASALLVAVGLYVRRQVGETPAFARLVARAGQVRVPLGEVLRHHGRNLVLGSLAMVVCYAIFYISTVFALDYGVRVGHIPRSTFLGVLCVGIVVMGIVTPISAVLSDRFGCRPVLLAGSMLAAASGFAMAPLLGAGTAGSALAFVCLELALMGLVFAPMGALLPSLFPAEVRYTGASATYNIGGILGASLAPYVAQLLLLRGGLSFVGLYITVAAAVSFVALIFARPNPAGS